MGHLKTGLLAITGVLMALTALAETPSAKPSAATANYGPLTQTDKVVKPIPPKYKIEDEAETKKTEPLRSDRISTHKWKQRGITQNGSENIFEKDGDAYVCVNPECKMARKVPERRD